MAASPSVWMGRGAVVLMHCKRTELRLVNALSSLVDAIARG